MEKSLGRVRVVGGTRLLVLRMLILYAFDYLRITPSSIKAFVLHLYHSVKKANTVRF